MTLNEFTINDLLKAVMKRIVLVTAIPFVLMSIVSYYSFVLLPNEYTATTSLYVLNRQSQDSIINTSDLSSSLSLVSDYKKLITSRRVMQAVADKYELDNLDMFTVKVTADNNTRVIDLSVTGTNPSMAANVANMLAEEFSQIVVEIMQVENVSVIDIAYPPTSPSGPSRQMYIAVSLLAGLAFSVFLVYIMETMRITIGSPKEAEELYNLPVLGRIPELRKRR